MDRLDAMAAFVAVADLRGFAPAARRKVVLADFEPPPVPIHLVYPTTRLLSAKVRAFVELATTTREWSFVKLS